MKINMQGQIDDQKLTDLILQQNLKVKFNTMAIEKMNMVLNKHFNEENVDQTIRENFNKSISRLCNSKDFKELLTKLVGEKLILILETKDFTKIIDESCKKYIDSVIKNIKA